MTCPDDYEDDWPDDDERVTVADLAAAEAAGRVTAWPEVDYVLAVEPEPDSQTWRHTVTIHPEGDRL